MNDKRPEGHLDAQLDLPVCVGVLVAAFVIALYLRLDTLPTWAAGLLFVSSTVAWFFGFRIERRVVRSKFYRVPRDCWGIGLALVASAAAWGDAPPNPVPAEFTGIWVPSKASCDSPVRALVAADSLTLVNGSDRAVLGGIEMAGPGYFAHDYEGIMAVLITEFSDQQPAIMTFNLDEKRGVARLDFSPLMPGSPTPILNAYNARISQLSLAKRFPLNQVPLTKCPRDAG